MKRSTQLILSTLLCSPLIMLGGCSDSDNNDPAGDDPGTTSLDMPEELNLVLLNASTSDYYSFDTSTETRADLNEIANASQDSAIQKLAITDTSTIGHFLHWPDFRVVNEEEHLDMKYVLMNSGYESGTTIDADQFVQLAHLHDNELAAHSADEFSNAEPGSGKAAALARLNSFVEGQKELEDELSEVMPDGQQLCRAFVDPYLQFELEEEAHEEEGSEETGEVHEHGELMHIALSDTGRMYFFEEGENGLESAQGFVTLDDVSSISDCNRTTIARASEDGVLVFVPDAQKIYLVDAHGGDFHQHSTWDISALLPEGVSADMLAVIGDGGEHDHE